MPPETSIGGFDGDRRMWWATKTGGIHNVFYQSAEENARRWADGAPSLTIFVNQQEPGHSFAYEFAFRPVREGSAHDGGGDDVFHTRYVSARLPFFNSNNGGARPIGEGLYAVAGGSAGNLTIVDRNNDSQTMAPLDENGEEVQSPYYDGFPFVRLAGARYPHRAHARPPTTEQRALSPDE